MAGERLTWIKFEDPEVVHKTQMGGAEIALVRLKHNNDLGGDIRCRGEVDVWVPTQMLGDDPPKDKDGHALRLVYGCCTSCDKEVKISRLGLVMGIDLGLKQKQMLQPEV